MAAAASIDATSPAPELELSIVIPCLDEAETLATCVRQAGNFLAEYGVAGEIVIADNGSTDGSRDIARALGARVVEVPIRGYGAALRAGIDAAHSRYVAIGDGDASYDFGALPVFINELRAGADIVIGDRFKGGIAPGAMPWLHRYLGNPVLSFLGRLFFNLQCRDFHCGLRAFSRAAILKLELRTTGMEYASEMLARAGLAGLKIVDVPVRLARAGRSRGSHLRTWRDGWRHLRVLLLLAPNWLFVYPGLIMIAAGLLIGLVLVSGGTSIAPGFASDPRSFLIPCFSFLAGLQSVTFGLLARRCAATRGFLLPPRLDRIVARLTLRQALLAGVIMLALGTAGCAWSCWMWREAIRGVIPCTYSVRLTAAGLTVTIAVLQLALAALLAGVITVE